MQVNITISTDLPNYKTMEFSEHRPEVIVRSGEGAEIPPQQPNAFMQLQLLEKLFLEARYAVLMQMPLELRTTVPEVMWVDQDHVEYVLRKKLAANK